MASNQISIIVPIYNKERYLPETLRSIENQTYLPHEVILIDDGSSDSSSTIADRFAAQANPFKVKNLRQENRGISAARNVAISQASGSLIVCNDGDDLMAQNFLEVAFRRFCETDADIVCSNVKLFGGENGQWIPDPYDPYFIRYNNMVPTLCLFKRTIWEQSGGYKVALPFAEDWEFWVNCSKFVNRVEKIEQDLFLYRRTEEGLHSRFLEKKWDLALALVMFANPELYNIEDLRVSQNKFFEAPEEWYTKIIKQYNLHPNDYLLNIFYGMYLEFKGDIDKSLALYGRASELSKFKAWLPLYRIGKILEGKGNSIQAAQLYHQVRIMRPDMHFIVGKSADLKSYPYS